MQPLSVGKGSSPTVLLPPVLTLRVRTSQSAFSAAEPALLPQRPTRCHSLRQAAGCGEKPKAPVRAAEGSGQVVRPLPVRGCGRPRSAGERLGTAGTRPGSEQLHKRQQEKDLSLPLPQQQLKVLSQDPWWCRIIKRVSYFVITERHRPWSPPFCIHP